MDTIYEQDFKVSTWIKSSKVVEDFLMANVPGILSIENNNHVNLEKYDWEDSPDEPNYIITMDNGETRDVYINPGFIEKYFPNFEVKKLIAISGGHILEEIEDEEDAMKLDDGYEEEIYEKYCNLDPDLNFDVQIIKQVTQ